jgi:hypothetical protein
VVPPSISRIFGAENQTGFSALHTLSSSPPPLGNSPITPKHKKHPPPTRAGASNNRCFSLAVQ